MLRIQIRAAAAALFLVAIASGSSARAEETITVGTVGTGSSLNWPVYIAQEQGFFAKQGLSVDYVAAPSSAAVQQQVAAGSVDLGSGGLVDPVRAIDKGAPISIFRIEATAAPYALFAKPEIKSYGQLVKKTISIGGIKDITRIYLERMLVPNGVKPGDYDMVFAGATSARFAALSSGSVDAAILTSPFNFKAETAGFTKLGTTVDYVRDFPFSGFAANTAWAKAHKEALAKFLVAYAAGVDWFYDPANRPAAVAILIKRTAALPDDADKTYGFFQDLKIYDAKGSVIDSGLGNLLKIMKDLGEIDGSSDVARFYDPSIVMAQ
ncbi:MAG: transporter substrate-binding protein [Rhodospirillales bacterium]|jgi:NitT/TauT family transport system substrate-binding protein|nr:transporter substrate-binding protein [Rhodospirillales bacterium]